MINLSSNCVKSRSFLLILVLILSSSIVAQETELSTKDQQIADLKRSELAQSISLRSLLIPGYKSEIKALTARQAYNFWKDNTGDKLVSHLNVYAALHDANKYIGYDSINGTFYNQISGHGDIVVSVRFGNTPNIFYSAGSDGRIMKWDLTAQNPTPLTLYSGPELFKSLDISDDDSWLLGVTREDGIVLINLLEKDHTSFSELGETSVSRDLTPVQSAIFVPGSSEYLSITKTGELRLRGFKIDTVKAITDKQVITMAMSQRNKKVYAGTDEGVVQMWDAEMDESYLEIPELHRINALAISPDKTMMAIGREKGDAIIWDLDKDQLLRTIDGHQSAIMDLAFSPDNQLLLTASRDGTSRVFEIQNKRKLPMVFDDHNDWVMTATFDHTGTRAITGSKDGFIRVWDLDMSRLADRLCGFISRDMTELEWLDYVGEGIPFEDGCN